MLSDNNCSIIDTNILLRFLTGDDKGKAAQCEALFQNAINGNERLLISDVCIAELIWTLESYYREERFAIADKVESLLNTPGFEYSDIHLLFEAIKRYRSFTVDYIDAYHAAMAKKRSCDIYSYDKDFDKLKDINRKEPK